MNTEQVSLWQRLRSNFAFLPAAALSLGVLSGLLMSYLEAPLRQALPDLEGVLNSPESARAALTAIATSSLTIAALAVSLTLAVLTHIGAQYSPRALGTFMRDTVSQSAIGLLLAVHAYCLVVMRDLDGGERSPQFAASLGVLAGFVSVAMLIYYLHHIASSLRASRVVAAIAADTDRLLRQAESEADDADLATEWGVCKADGAAQFKARRSGYLQSVDIPALDAAAEKANARVRLARPLAGFVMQGEVLAEIWSANERWSFENTLAASIVIGDHPESEQDAYAGLAQLVDLALRALSPGLNDPHSAGLAIDRLGALLCAQARVDRLKEKVSASFELLQGYGVEGKHQRIALPRRSSTDLVRLCLDPIRQNAGGQSKVYHRLLTALERLLVPAQRDAKLADLIADQLQVMSEAIDAQLEHAYDRAPQQTMLHALQVQVRQLQASQRPT